VELYRYSPMCLHGVDRHNFTFLPFFFRDATAPLGPRCLIVEGSRSHKIRHTHTRQDSSEQVISSSQRPLPTQHTTNTGKRHPCPLRYSKPRSQQSSSRRLSVRLKTSRPPGWAQPFLYLPKSLTDNGRTD
jgi:hypothetical protein